MNDELLQASCGEHGDLVGALSLAVPLYAPASGFHEFGKMTVERVPGRDHARRRGGFDESGCAFKHSAEQIRQLGVFMRRMTAGDRIARHFAAYAGTLSANRAGAPGSGRVELRVTCSELGTQGSWLGP